MARIVAKITVTEAEASCAQNTILTSGMAGTQLEFSFSEQWDGLAKTVVFIAGTADPEYVDLNTDNTCVIPESVLTTARIPLVVGVYGADGTTVVIPTIYTSLGLIAVGTALPSDEEIGVTQSLYDQITALQVAMSAELVDIKETGVKDVDIDATDVAHVGTPSASLVTSWIDEEDHGKGKKATFVFKNLKGNGITKVEFNDSNNLVITFDDGSTSTFDGVATAISSMKSTEESVKSAESSRVDAEKKRASAETKRADAETARATEWNDLDSEIRVAAATATEKASEAETSADRAEQAAQTAGYMFFTNTNGRLIYNKTTNTETDFTLENGRLEAVIP